MAERLKGIAKGGWHPKGSSDGARESRLGSIKGGSTVAGWMGKGKSPSEAAHAHQSAPLSSLRDPDSFGPPPKHVDFYGPGAAQQSSSRGSSPAQPAPSSADSARARLQAKKEAQARAEEEAKRPPPGPYRVNTTGLRTDHLPKPPPFRPGQSTPPSAIPTTSSKPKLPPRLPPRQNSHPDLHAPAPPPPYSAVAPEAAPAESLLNQDALNRLGKAGVSVPGLEMGRRTSSPPVPPRRTGSPAVASPPIPTPRSPQVSELQSRFASMSTATDRRPSPASPLQSPVLPSQAAAMKKKPPPPPPKKNVTTNAAQPPPIPFGSKPKF